MPKCGTVYLNSNKYGFNGTVVITILDLINFDHSICSSIKDSHRLMVENYKINYFDKKTNFGEIMNSTFIYLGYIPLNSSRRFIFQIHYLPKSRISYVELDLQILSEEMPSDLKVSLHINDYRDCVVTEQSLSKANSVIEFKLICEAKSDVDYKIERKDLPNSLTFSFNSKTEFMSRIIRISVFRFQEECGSPDFPLNAISTINSGNSVNIYPSKPERYRIWGKDNDTVNCMYEGNWDKEFEPLYPIIKCRFDEKYWNSLHFTNISIEYFEYFNDTLYAAVDSKIQFQCSHQNSSVFHYLYCQEDGNWTRDQSFLDVCKGKGHL